MAVWNSCFWWQQVVHTFQMDLKWLNALIFISNKNSTKQALVINVTVHGFPHIVSTLNFSHYFECINACQHGEITLQFPELPCYSRALQPRDSAAYTADLSQAAWRLFRPFLGRWNIKRDPAGYTSNVIRVQHTTERAAHALWRLLIPGTLSSRQLMAVCLQRLCA